MTQTQPAHSSPFETENIGRLIARFAIPCVISMLVNSLYNIVDQIFIGQGVGYLGNAATNVAFPLVTISLAFSLLIGDGCAAFFSLRLGAKDKESAAKGVGNAITLAVGFGVLFLVFGTLFMTPLLRLFGSTDTVLPYAQDYTRIILIGLPFVLIGTAMNSIIRADGSPKYAMISMITGAVINTVLDPIFIFVFKWGVAGAAFATILGQIATAIISVVYIFRFKSIHFKPSLLKLNGKISRTVMSFGASSFITQVAITLVVVVMNNSLAFYGAQSVYGAEIPLSALGIVMKVNQILMSLLLGLGVGSQPIIGYNYGAKNFKRVKKTYLISVSIASICAIIGFILFQFCTQGIVNIFGQEDALYNQFALKSFRSFLGLCFLNGFQVVSSIYFQATGRPIKAATLSLSRQVLFLIPMILLLPRFFGVEGILFAGPVADGLAFVLAAIFILLEMRHLNTAHMQVNETEE